MKRVACVLAIVVTAFMGGCSDDSSFLNPLPETGSARHDFSKDIPRIRIPIHATLVEPGRAFNQILQIDGYLGYSFVVEQRDPPAAAVDVTVRALVKPFGYDEPIWKIAASSHDELELSQDGFASATKRFPIPGRADNLRLCIHFQISEAGMNILRMWLELPLKVAERSEE